MNETLAEATLAADRCMAAEKIVDALIGKGFVQPDDRIPVKHAVIDVLKECQ